MYYVLLEYLYYSLLECLYCVLLECLYYLLLKRLYFGVFVLCTFGMFVLRTFGVFVLRTCVRFRVFPLRYLLPPLVHCRMVRVFVTMVTCVTVTFGIIFDLHVVIASTVAVEFGMLIIASVTTR